MCEDSQLIHFDVKKPFKLFCAYGVREALAIIFGVRRFHQYLYGRSFMLVTDHRPLCKILGEREGLAAARTQCWVLVFCAYRYQIQHTPGKQNHLADCLSRLPSPHEDRDSV